MTDAELLHEIETLLADAQPVELVAGTMDVDRLENAMASIRDSLTQQALDEVVRAMNDEYIQRAVYSPRLPNADLL